MMSAGEPTPVPKTSMTESRASATKGKSWFKCRTIGVGACAGQDVMSNDNFETLVDTSDAWITKRTGIRSRHIIKAGSSLREIAVISANEALVSAKTNPLEIDLVIVATSSPDDLFGDAASVALAVGKFICGF